MCSLVFLTSACTPSNTKSTKHQSHTNLICQQAASYAGKVVGDGECVSLIKICSGSPETKYWRPGAKVMTSSKLKAGTVIATFKNNRYPNLRGYHAAIYIKHDKKGIWVWDQWRGKAVHQRLIKARHDGATANNTANAYRVVELAQ